MRKTLLSAITLLVSLFSIKLMAQSKINDYKAVYDKAESFVKASPNFTVSAETENALKKFDTQSPSSYFGEATYFLEKDVSKYNDALALFTIGNIRHNYYIAVNKDYAPNDNWATAESMNAVYKEKVNIYLQQDINEYKSILKYAIDYCNKNNYSYYTKPKKDEEHKKAIEPFETLIKNLEVDKDKYIKEWHEERAAYLAKEAYENLPEVKYANIDTTQIFAGSYNSTPIVLDTIKNIKDVKTYYNFNTVLQQERFIVSKTNFDLTKKISTLIIGDTEKLELSKIFLIKSQEHSEDLTLPQADRFYEKFRIASETREAIEYAQKKRVKQILGKAEGEKFWDDTKEFITKTRQDIEKM